MPAKTSTSPSPSRAADPLLPIGHIVSALLAAWLLFDGVAALRANTQVLLVMTLIVLGSVTAALTWQSWRGSRAAWSFLVVIHGALAFYTLLGAPKLRDMAGVSLGVALVPPVAHLVVVVTLALCAHRYRERDTE